jgi:cell division protein FtsL
MASVPVRRAHKRTAFLLLWTVAVIATTTAFVLCLALRVRSVELGYELGRAQARISRLREVQRVLELEISSYKTPERIDLIARGLFGMEQPSADRILPLGRRPLPSEDSEAGGAVAAGDPRP